MINPSARKFFINPSQDSDSLPASTTNESGLALALINTTRLGTVRNGALALTMSLVQATHLCN